MSRRATLFVAVLALAGCRVNEDELRVVQQALTTRLAQRQELAQRLNERRREMDALEKRLAQALTEFGSIPEAAVSPYTEVQQAEPIAALPPMPTLPDVSWFEGSRSTRQRAEIDETRRRIFELEKVLDEVARINRRKKRVEQKLQTLDGLRETREQSSPDAGHPAKP